MNLREIAGKKGNKEGKQKLKEAIENAINKHIEFRQEWGEWFPTPNMLETTFFIIQELGEVGDAEFLNDGKFARNNNGNHKATDVSKELADLWIMLHTYTLVYQQASGNYPEWQYSLPVQLQETFLFLCDNGNEIGLVQLADVVTEVVKAGLYPEAHSKFSHRFRIERAMSYTMAHPEFEFDAVEQVFYKWQKRAEKKRDAL